jgi:hypothetical protein
MSEHRGDTRAKQSYGMLRALGSVDRGHAGVSIGPGPGVHDGLFRDPRRAGWLSHVRRGTPAG